MSAVVAPTARTSDPEAAESLRSCLRHLLLPSADGRWRMPDDISTDRFAAMAVRHRVVPLLHRHLDRLDLGDELAGRLRRRGEASRLQSLLLVRELGRALTALEAAGIAVLVVKGIALAQAAHGDPAARGLGDLDLLVAPSEVGRACQALAGVGWSPAGGPAPGDGRPWDHALRFGYERCLVGKRSLVDLHWRLDPTAGALPGFASLWPRREYVRVGDLKVPTLGRWDALLHSCSHAAKDDWRWLRSLADVVVLAADDELWRDPPTRPTLIQQATLGLAFTLLGDPAVLPVRVARSAAAAAAGRQRHVRHEQAILGERSARGRLPGFGTLATVRRYWRGHRTPAELYRVVVATAVPGHLLGGLNGHGWIRGTRTVLGRRLARLKLWCRRPDTRR